MLSKGNIKRINLGLYPIEIEQDNMSYHISNHYVSSSHCRFDLSYIVMMFNGVIQLPLFCSHQGCASSITSAIQVIKLHEIGKLLAKW